MAADTICSDFGAPQNQDHHHGKILKKSKWLPGEAFQRAVTRREEKSKGRKERYKHQNADFQRLARRDKKAILSNQCKEIEEKKQNGED